MNPEMYVQKTLKRKVMKFGNAAHIVVPKQYIGSTAYVLIKGRKKADDYILIAVNKQELTKIWNISPNIKEIDWKDFQNRDRLSSIS